MTGLNLDEGINKDDNSRGLWDYLAFGISAIFSPYIMAAVFIVIITSEYSQNVKQFLPWMGIAFFFDIIIPAIYVLWLIEKKDVHDIHLGNHKQRKIPFIVMAISSVLGAIALTIVDAAKPVIVMGVAYAVNSSAIAILTTYWKVSVHTALFAAVATVIVILFGVEWVWMYLLIIPLAWSRIYRQKHTLNQVIGGSIIAFVLTSLVFWAFGYL